MQKHETHENTHTHTDAYKDSDEYSIVALCKNATIKNTTLQKPVNSKPHNPLHPVPQRDKINDLDRRFYKVSLLSFPV